MRFVSFRKGKYQSIGLVRNNSIIDLPVAGKQFHYQNLPNRLANYLELGNKGMKIAQEILHKIDIILTTLKSETTDYLISLDAIKFLSPVDNPQKIICIGQNYIDHCKEQGIEPPDRPILFSKFNNTLTGHFTAVPIPIISDKIDFEAELAIIIGKKGKQISPQNAYDYIAGYTILNDITARDIQKIDGQWLRAKSSDSFAPCGPWMVTKDEISNPHNLFISLKLNGQIMQNSNTKNLIFDIPYLISFISQNITLQPGDIISTGTPPGVGFVRKPPTFLQSGDKIETTIESIGTLINRIQ